MKTHSSSPHNRGFTLIELLVVITIIAILAGISVGGYGFVTRKQAESQAAVQISLLSKALEEYKLDNGSYPPNGNTNSIYKALYWDTDGDNNGASTDTDQKFYLADLDPNSKRQGWIEGTGANATIRDPWGNEYIYTTGAAAKNPDFDLASRGKDGTIGTPDDIDNY